MKFKQTREQPDNWNIVLAKNPLEKPICINIYQHSYAPEHEALILVPKSAGLLEDWCINLRSIMCLERLYSF